MPNGKRRQHKATRNGKTFTRRETTITKPKPSLLERMHLVPPKRAKNVQSSNQYKIIDKSSVTPIARKKGWATLEQIQEAHQKREELTAKREERERKETAKNAKQNAIMQGSIIVVDDTAQKRYDEMLNMMARQRKNGQKQMVWPDQYGEFFDGPGQLKPRPTTGKRERMCTTHWNEYDHTCLVCRSI